MSWFTELASKAEAMLVKLDQDTAQALQNSNLQVSTTKPESNYGQTNTKYSEHENDPIREPEKDSAVTFAVGQALGSTHKEIEFNNDTANRIDNVQAANGVSYDNITDNVASPLKATRTSLISTPDEHTVTEEENNGEFNNTQTLQALENSGSNTTVQQSSFRLETSKLKPNLYKGQFKQTITQANGRSKSSRRNVPAINVGADDIRASITKTLQEYSLASSRDGPTSYRIEPASYSSHFDDQPNLISQTGSDDDDRIGRLHPSPSFSIDVPDDQATDITSQILKQGPLNKRTPFNLHKVINRLASHRGHSQSIFGDKTKIRLRRAQMRAAGYLRRMNYYFQAYPTMKYWMIGYLVILQILVVYVLFFYQSSGSSSYLTEQVKHQQVDLNEDLQSPKK